MTAATPGNAELLACLLPFIRAGDVSKGEPSFWFADGAQEVLDRLAAKPAEEVREACEKRKAKIIADIDHYDWRPPSSAWHRAFGEMAGLNFALGNISTTGQPKP